MMTALTGWLAVLGVGCGNSKSGGAPSSTSNLASPGCATTPPDAGSKTVTLMSGGLARSYILHVPTGYAGQPTPLVINMHGFLSDASQQESWSAMDTVADSEGFLVAYPNGAGSPSSWNAGACCEFTDTSRDDVAFVSAVIDDVAQSHCVELDRVYATGMSNGGFMSQNLACNLSDRIAAIGPVAGVIGIAPVDCTPARPIPVMEFHGTADPLVPYDGGSPSASLWSLLYPDAPPPTFESVAYTVDFWRNLDGCGPTPTQTFSNGDATCESYTGCQGGVAVTLCTIAGGGHTWPGGNPNALPSEAALFTGPMSTSINASSQLWNFFKAYTLPSGFDAGVTATPPYTLPPLPEAGPSDAGAAPAAEASSDAAEEVP
jgi:polyhydroxybutyrate depolymerase